MNIEDLGDDELDLFPESEMIALVDADTVAVFVFLIAF